MVCENLEVMCNIDSSTKDKLSVILECTDTNKQEEIVLEIDEWELMNLKDKNCEHDIEIDYNLFTVDKFESSEEFYFKIIGVCEKCGSKFIYEEIKNLENIS